MTEVIWVSIIGVLGTVAGSVVGFLCNKTIETKRANNDARLYMSRLQFDLQIDIFKQLSKAFFKVLVILNTVEGELKEGDKDLDRTKDTLLRLVEATCKAQDLLFEYAPFIPESIYTQYDKLNDVINNQFWEYHDKFIKSRGNVNRESVLSDLTTKINLIEHMIRGINAEIRKTLSNTSIV